jgi:hypothetical protein
MIQMKASTDVPAGGILVKSDEKGNLTVLYNKSDERLLRDISRLVGTRRGKAPAVITSEVNKELAVQKGSVTPVQLSDITARTAEHTKVPAFTRLSDTTSAVVRGPLEEADRQFQAFLRTSERPTVILGQTDEGAFTVLASGMDEKLTVRTPQAIKETLEQYFTYSASYDKPVVVLARDIASEKVDAIVKNANDAARARMAQSPRIITMFEKEAVPWESRFKEMNQIFDRKDIRFDYKVAHEIIEEGPFKGFVQVTTDITIPLAKASLIVRIRTIIRDFSQAVAVAISKSISRILTLGSAKTTIADFTAELHQSLEADLKSMGFDSLQCTIDKGLGKENYDLHISSISSRNAML